VQFISLSVSARVYNLPLADGTTWSIRGLGSTGAWVGYLARLMSLAEAGGPPTHRLTFVRAGEDCVARPDTAEFLPVQAGDAWETVYYLGSCTLYHRQAPEAVCQLPPWEATRPDWSRDERWIRAKHVAAVEPVYRAAEALGGLRCHGALAECAGVGAMLLGPSGAGKSTICRAAHGPWRVLCDDECLIVRTPDAAYRAHPFPTWSNCLAPSHNASWPVPSHVPVGGLFFLEQQPRPGCRALTPERTAALLGSLSLAAFGRRRWGVLRGPACRRALTEMAANVCHIAAAVPGFVLGVGTPEDAWVTLSEVPALQVPRLSAGRQRGHVGA